MNSNSSTEMHWDLVQSNEGLDLETIRRRVASIKNNWTPEMTRQRAAEGRRRRAALESMVAAIEMSAIEEKMAPQLSLVG